MHGRKGVGLLSWLFAHMSSLSHLPFALPLLSCTFLLPTCRPAGSLPHVCSLSTLPTVSSLIGLGSFMEAGSMGSGCDGHAQLHTLAAWVDSNVESSGDSTPR